ncbi:MAG TPA: glycosyltransferase [Thermosynechococcaceae cyanobacterium]
MNTAVQLSWGLVIATYRREKVLPMCIKFAVEQTRRPIEVVVVDASDYWETTRDTVMTEIASQHPDIRWVYVAAEQRSLTVQRNQAIRLATADIAFLFDDDSLMYPDCAEEVMRVYEADPEQIVKGVQANPHELPPSDPRVSDSKHYTAESKGLYSRYGFLSAIYRFLWKNLLLMDSGINFIPYDGRYPTHVLPSAVQQLHIAPAILLAGFRMTYRREAVLKEPFEPLLRYYAAWEDVDASYRVSRQGALLTALDADVHHFYSASGRINRLQVAALSSLNQAIFLRKYSSNLRRDKRAFYQLMARRVIAEALKDTLSCRWKFPQLRGILVALKHAPSVFFLPLEELNDWYPSLQKQIIEMT